MSKIFNEYQARAVYVPTFLVFMPLLFFLLLNSNLNYWFGHAMIRLSLLSMLFYISWEYIIRNFWRILESRIFKQKNVFPTIKILKGYSDLFDEIELKEIFKKIEKEYKVKLKDIRNDNKKLIFLNKKILNKVQNWRLVLDKNISYWVCRNFIWGSIIGLILSLILFYIEIWNLNSFIYLGFAAIYSFSFLFRYEFLNFYGNIYAKTLFEEYLSINK